MQLDKSIKVKRVCLKYAWKWNIEGGCCLICQQDFNSCCYSCEHPMDCYPALGQCDHSFHLHCIDPWVSENHHCPLCRQDWVVKKIYKFK